MRLLEQGRHEHDLHIDASALYLDSIFERAVDLADRLSSNNGEEIDIAASELLDELPDDMVSIFTGEGIIPAYYMGEMFSTVVTAESCPLITARLDDLYVSAYPAMDGILPSQEIVNGMDMEYEKDDRDGELLDDRSRAREQEERYGVEHWNKNRLFAEFSIFNLTDISMPHRGAAVMAESIRFSAIMDVQHLQILEPGVPDRLIDPHEAKDIIRHAAHEATQTSLSTGFRRASQDTQIDLLQTEIDVVNEMIELTGFDIHYLPVGQKQKTRKRKKPIKRQADRATRVGVHDTLNPGSAMQFVNRSQSEVTSGRIIGIESPDLNWLKESNRRITSNSDMHNPTASLFFVVELYDLDMFDAPTTNGPIIYLPINNTIEYTLSHRGVQDRFRIS